MKDICREIAPHLAALDQDPDQPVADPRLAQHLAECGACQRSLKLQRAMHGLLRARSDELQARAPEELRVRCAGHMQASWAARRRWALWRLPLAASALIGMAGVATYGLTSLSPGVLAAQLTVDHIKCARLVSPGARPDASQAIAEWARRYEWTPPMLSLASSHRASLVAVRRCLYGHGHLAHLLYDVDGRTVSVFVMPRREYPDDVPPAHHAFLGQRAQVWGRGAQAFAVVGDVPDATLASMAEALRAAVD
jgi:anti-sigma factor RsiW